ncbi:hypothetical protein C8Q78DRAFT_1001836 [Trametes maxima]|nr:hypothetical protein C8Q78DRAFT_1001836 [Trametes maxima]
MSPSPNSSRKKPICHTCGYPMAGHKRPHGSPVCPRDSASPAPSLSPSPPNRRSVSTLPCGTPDPPQRTLLSRISPEDVRSSPTPSGYWHRQNPNWVEPEHYARIPGHAVHHVPQRGETAASWNSTELDEAPQAYFTRGESVPQHGFEVVDEDDAEEDDADSQRTVSPPPSGSFARITRGISKLFGDAPPLARVYGASSNEAVALEHTAQEHGLYAGVARRHPLVKTEPPSPGARLGDASRSTLSRDGSCLVFVGHDRSTVDALAASHSPRGALRAASREPYDYDAGLAPERNERVGAYPVDPRSVRQNYCDVIIAAVVSAFCAVWFLSLM